MLPETTSVTIRRLTRELGAFGVVGATAFLVDVGVFQLLYAVAGVDPVAAKLVATLTATAVAYVVLRYGLRLSEAPDVRRAMIVLFSLAFVAAGVAGLFGALITKVAPLF